MSLDDWGSTVSQWPPNREVFNWVLKVIRQILWWWFFSIRSNKCWFLRHLSSWILREHRLHMQSRLFQAPDKVLLFFTVFTWSLEQVSLTEETRSCPQCVDWHSPKWGAGWDYLLVKLETGTQVEILQMIKFESQQFGWPHQALARWFQLKSTPFQKKSSQKSISQNEKKKQVSI